MKDIYEYEDDYMDVAKEMGLDDFNPLDNEIIKELRKNKTLMPRQ